MRAGLPVRRATRGGRDASSATGKRAAARAVVMHHVILRTAWVYGAYGRNFVKTILRLGAKQPALRVVAVQHGCFTAAADMIAGKSNKADQSGGTFHLAGSGSVSWYGFEEIVRLAEKFGAWAGAPRPRVEPITTHQYKTPARRPMNLRPDRRKIANSLSISLSPWRARLAAVVRELAAKKNR